MIAGSRHAIQCFSRRRFLLSGPPCFAEHNDLPSSARGSGTPDIVEALRFRRFQDAVTPGVGDLHRMLRAIFDTVLPEQASIMICGAGGGRELETLGASPQQYRLFGVDPSSEMLGLARACVAQSGIAGRTTLTEGGVADLPGGVYDAATSLFVMHFVPDDGGKAQYLLEIRSRLRTRAPYLHVDVCYENPDAYHRLARVYQRHAELGGLPAEDAARVAHRVAELSVIPEDTLLERFAGAGFRPISPFYRGLWYTGWWTEAV